MSYERTWTGRIWSETTSNDQDGRSIQVGAVKMPDPVPLICNGEQVGTVEGIAELGAVGLAVGDTSLAPGTYGIGMDLIDVQAVFDEDGAGMTVELARLGAVTVYAEGSGLKPRWADAVMVVTEKS